MKLNILLLLIFLAMVTTSLEAQASGFTDSDLHVLLDSQKSGMILIWSKDMPLSAYSVSDSPAIANKLGFDLIIVEHLEMKSSILVSLGVLNHFPAVTLYKDGKLLPIVIHGYEEPKSLYNLLKDHK